MHSEYTIKDGALCHSSLPCAGLWRFRCLLTIKINIHEFWNMIFGYLWSTTNRENPNISGALDPEGPGGPSALSSQEVPKKFGGEVGPFGVGQKFKNLRFFKQPN